MNAAFVKEKQTAYRAVCFIFAFIYRTNMEVRGWISSVFAPVRFVYVSQFQTKNAALINWYELLIKSATFC